jgi:tetratricopeptide (TPR) repeat protein
LRPDPALLNDLGSVIARYSPQVDSLNERLAVTTVIQWGMFSGAAHLGCDISTFSMARWIAIASYHDKDISKRPLFRPIMDLHKTYLDEGKPMALFAEGEYLLRTGKTDAAIRVLTRAVKESSKTLPWWPAMCNALGAAHSMNEETPIALRYWEKAIQEGSLDALKAYYQYTAPGDDRDDAMYKLACKGDVEVLGEIAELEGRKASDDEFATPGEKKFQEKWASEWMKMTEYDIQVRTALSRRP